MISRCEASVTTFCSHACRRGRGMTTSPLVGGRQWFVSYSGTIEKYMHLSFSYSLLSVLTGKIFFQSMIEFFP